MCNKKIYCYWCGNPTLTIEYNQFYETYKVVCKTCRTSGLASNTIEDAWNNWNKTECKINGERNV